MDDPTEFDSLALDASSHSYAVDIQIFRGGAKLCHWGVGQFPPSPHPLATGMTLRYTTPDIRCRDDRLDECDGGINAGQYVSCTGDRVLIRRTRYFFPTVSRNHGQYSEQQATTLL